MIGPDDSLGIMPAAGTYYRVVRAVPLDPTDFRSQAEQGRTVPKLKANDLKYQRQFQAPSVHDTYEQSRKLADYFPKLGNLIVELVIPEGTDLTHEYVTDGGDGHGVLYNASSEILVTFVTRVFGPDGNELELPE
jgi:hypothetical protein